MLQSWLDQLRKNKWTTKEILQSVGRLQKTVLSAKSQACTAGLQAFVVENFLQELSKNFAEHADEIAADLPPLYQPFCDILKTADT